MKKIFFLIVVLVSAFTSVLTSCTSETNAAPVTLQGLDASQPSKSVTLVVERSVLSFRNGVLNTLLLSDGSALTISANDAKRKLIQRGDTVIVRFHDVTDIKFRREPLK